MKRSARDDDAEALQEYILLVLADSNLPTGGFVASAGLESYWAHGLFQLLGRSPFLVEQHGQNTAAPQLVAFIAASLDTYASTVAGYLLDVHRIAWAFKYAPQNGDERAFMLATASKIVRLDESLHAMTLNHVAQRASKAQGVALLTLYAKSFAPFDTRTSSSDEPQEAMRKQAEQRASSLLQELKLCIRRGDCHGHLPICWAVFMAALGIQEGKRALAVHLFLQARAILSSAVRLNIVGPYLSHRLLAYDVNALIKKAVSDVASFTMGLDEPVQLEANGAVAVKDGGSSNIAQKDPSEWEWTWPEDGAWDRSAELAPRTTWPLGDLLQARHDQLHSRLFNS